MMKWHSPRVTELGITIADARRLAKQARRIWITIATSRYGWDGLPFERAAFLRSIKFESETSKLPAELNIVSGALWIGMIPIEAYER